MAKTILVICVWRTGEPLLEKAKLVKRSVVDGQPPRSSYETTEAGLALRPVFESIRAWSDRFGWKESL